MSVLSRFLSLTRWWPIAAAAGVIVAGGLFYQRTSSHRNHDSLARLALSAAARNDLSAAQRLADEAASNQPVSAESWRAIAEVNFRNGNYSRAADAWERVPERSSRAPEARLRAADTSLRQLRQLSRAERLYREVLSVDPDKAEAVDGLAQILAIEGRTNELATLLLRLIQLDAYSNFHLDLLARGPGVDVDPQLLPAGDRLAEGDLAARCARARLALHDGEPNRSRRELESILDIDPGYAPAQVLLGHVLLALGANELEEWLHQASPAVQSDTAYWRVAMTASEGWRDIDGSARCAWEVLVRDPNDIAASLCLARAMSRMGESELAEELVQRADRLERYLTSVAEARRPRNWSAMKSAVELAESLGMYWEAVGWCRLASRLNPKLTWPRPILERLAPKLVEIGLVRTDPAFNPASRIDSSRLSTPRFNLAISDAPNLPADVRAQPLSFRDDAQAAGLEFNYHNGGDPTVGLQRMFEFTGGGAGAVDFDRDGYPDLYFPEGGDFSQPGQSAEFVDRLWRNVAGQAWRDVTSSARLVDGGFGQGICVGDLDNDGFPDLLILNIGKNILLHNNGDGTFRQSQEFEKHAGDAWSLSAAIADLDGDANPDIYVVNYLGGDDVFSRVCPDSQGEKRLTCQPLIFAPTPDQLLRGAGDGGFQDSSKTCGINGHDGRGMGLIVARMARPDALDVYVSNDSTANFHFVRQPPSTETESSLRYADEALLRGVAVDSAGRAQASMGIAVNDVEGDGRLDLFITNFEGESNALYVQESEGNFRDSSQQFGLTADSRDMLGFGTQFMDADLDGFPDLLVANGHVNDRREANSQFRMKPQLFRNLAGQKFQLVPEPEAGAYFDGHYLGRGLAVLDWNRDGRPDAAVTHLDHPTALLTNQSPTRGRWLVVHCVGTASARDAIGTTLSVQPGSRRIVRQITAGDGYASSNQRVVFFGLGEGSNERLTLDVSWPSGETATFTDIPIDTEVVIIEGRPRAIPLFRDPHPRASTPR